MRENQGLQTDHDKIMRGEPRRGLIIAIVVDLTIAIIVLVGLGIHYSTYTTYTPGSQTLLKAETTELNGHNSFVYGFTLYSNMTKIRISGVFSSNRSVYFMIITAKQFESLSTNKSMINNPDYHIWSSGNTSEENISVSLNSPSKYLPPQDYYIMFYNAYPFSGPNHSHNIALINVTASIVLTYEFENVHYRVKI